MSNYDSYLGTSDERLIDSGKNHSAVICCGPSSGNPAVRLERLRWWTNVLLAIVVGLLIWVGVATSAMGYGLISTQPQLERTTSYTHAMKISTEGAINGTQHFIQQRLAQFPDNQVDVWLHQISNSLGSVTRIVDSIDKSVHTSTSPAGIEAIVHAAVNSLVGELVPAANKAAVGAIVTDAAAVVKKLREATDLMTPAEIAQGFRSISQLSQDTDEVVSAIKAALVRRGNN